jgi:hypothetical protein
MGEPLLCPNCKKGTMIWVDPYAEDILDKGVMECVSCQEQYIGMEGWIKAMGYENWIPKEDQK